MSYILWVASWVLCTVRWLQGPSTQLCQFSFLMLVLLQVWAEKRVSNAGLCPLACAEIGGQLGVLAQARQLKEARGWGVGPSRVGRGGASQFGTLLCL